MWEEVTVDELELLERVAAVSRLGDPRAALSTVDTIVAQDRSALSNGTLQMYYYQGSGFELTLRFTYQPRKKRYVTCFGLDGATTPEAALDLFLTQTATCMQQLGISEFYGMEPKAVDFPLLHEFYELVKTDPRVVETLLADLSDVWVYKVTLVSQP